MAVSISFTANPTRGTIPLTVQFTNTSSGGADAWFWDFGDGGYSTDQNPLYTYTTAPSEGEGFNVTLTGYIAGDATSISFGSYGSTIQRTATYIGIKGSGGGESNLIVYDKWLLRLPHTGWSSTGAWNSFGVRYALTGNSSTWGRQYYGAVIRTLNLDYSAYNEADHLAWATVTWVGFSDIAPYKVWDGGEMVYPVASGFPTTVGKITPRSSGTVTLLQNFAGSLGSNLTGMSVIDSNDNSRRMSDLGWIPDQAEGLQPWGYRGDLGFTLLSFVDGTVSTGTASLVIGPPFRANFSGTPRVGFDPLAVQFTDLSGPLPTNWRWNFGDGTPVGTTQHPSHTYTFPDSCE